jgi:hypothetical protein
MLVSHIPARGNPEKSCKNRQTLSAGGFSSARDPTTNVEDPTTKACGVKKL